MTRRAIIAIGTNLPFQGFSGEEIVGRSIEAVENEGLNIVARSSTWRTPAWPPGTQQPDYHNAVIIAEAGDLSPNELYQRLQKIELAFERRREQHWGSRTLDLDIIAMD